MTVIQALTTILETTTDQTARIVIAESINQMEADKTYQTGFIPRLRERIAAAGHTIDRKTISRIIRDTTAKKNQLLNTGK